MPDRDATKALSELKHPAAVQRDELGYTRISAGNRNESAYVTGYVHAQERFFQMDILRRKAAGELAELFGETVLPFDRKSRVHRFRTIAKAALEGLQPHYRQILESYAAGVRAGMRELGNRPFEYSLLKTYPEPWLAEDSLLVLSAMFLALQPDDGEPDRSRALVQELFSEKAAEWLLSSADDFEAPLDGVMTISPVRPATPQLVHASSTQLDRLSQSQVLLEQISKKQPSDSGSNAFALSGKHTASGAALVAGDMHMPFSVPNLWFRLQLAFFGPDKEIRIIAGVSLPGLPAIAAGANGAIAWTLTNANIDSADLVTLVPADENPDFYKTPEGTQKIEIVEEVIQVKDGPSETLRIETTRWGPVVGKDAAGRSLALKWTAHDPAAYDLNFLALEECGSARAALAIAKGSGLPQQNFVCGDRDGNIGWTIAGRLPRRSGYDGSKSILSLHASEKLWDGYLQRGEYPQIYNPEDGRIWSANARQLGGAAGAILGNGGYAFAARASALKEKIQTLAQATPADALAIQRSTQAPHFRRWQKLLLTVATPGATYSEPGREDLGILVSKWDGDAAADSASYRIIREFRDAVMQGVAGEVFAPCYKVFPEFNPSFLTLDRIAFHLATEQPAGWHSQGKEGWQKLLEKAALLVLKNAGGREGLAKYTWGKRNRLSMEHPLSNVSPLLGWWLNMPSHEMSGDLTTINALSPQHGPTVRFSVSPGLEADGLLQMPGGQSGHPLSPYFDAGHEDWVEGNPSPFVPGRIRENLSLRE